MAGGIARAWDEDPSNSSFRVIDKVKNPAIQKQINQSLTDYGTFHNTQMTSLADYISKYLANESQFDKYTNQDKATVDSYYNGSMAQQLATLRSNRASAISSAANLAGRQAIRSNNLSKVAGAGGPSSYDSRNLMRNLDEINTQAAVDNSNQARSDFGYLSGQQLNLMGQRQAMDQAKAGYAYQPTAWRGQALAQDQALLGNIENQDQVNNFYGLVRLRTGLERFAETADAIDTGVNNTWNMAMGAISAVEGGGGSQTQAQKPSVPSQYGANFSGGGGGTASYNSPGFGYQSTPLSYGSGMSPYQLGSYGGGAGDGGTSTGNNGAAPTGSYAFTSDTSTPLSYGSGMSPYQLGNYGL